MDDELKNTENSVESDAESAKRQRLKAEIEKQKKLKARR